MEGRGERRARDPRDRQSALGRPARPPRAWRVTVHGTATDARGLTTTYTYDALDRVVAVAGPLGETVTTSYDGHGNVATYGDALGNVTSYGYDALGARRARRSRV